MSASRIIQAYDLLQVRYGYTPERALSALKNRTAGIGFLGTDADIDEAVRLIESGTVVTQPVSGGILEEDALPPVLHRTDMDG